jgi:hypothetical protein
MGLPIGFSRCHCDTERIVYVDRPLPNPNPTRFDAVRVEQIGEMVVAEIHYHGCTNYEGRKVMVYDNCKVKDIEFANKLDPHFCERCRLSPVARFEPTRRGWDWAIAFAIQCQSFYSRERL